MGLEMLAGPSYYQHEQWFELRRIKRENVDGHYIEGVLIVNSYGRVREVWEDGTVCDLHNGGYGSPEKKKE